MLLRLNHVIADVLGIVPGVQIPNVDVIGLEVAEAGVEMGEQARLVSCLRLGGEHDLLAFGAKGRADHVLVVPVLDNRPGAVLEECLFRSHTRWEAVAPLPPLPITGKIVLSRR